MQQRWFWEEFSNWRFHWPKKSEKPKFFDVPVKSTLLFSETAGCFSSLRISLQFSFEKNYSISFAIQIVRALATEIWWPRLAKNWNLVCFIFLLRLGSLKATVTIYSVNVSINRFKFIKHQSISAISLSIFCAERWQAWVAKD